MKKKSVLIIIIMCFNLTFMFSQNTGSPNTWYKINSKGKYLTKIKTSGPYAVHEVLVHIINDDWSTAEVNYLSEYNYNHKRVKLEWGYTGSGMSRYLTVRVVPVTATSANPFYFNDIGDPSFDYGLTAVDESSVTLITPKNQLFIDEWTSKVGIGTITPDSKLTVAGNIHAQEVKVTIDAGADFVFHEAYKLPSLDTVEIFIKKNKHLPEIASAKDMEENGILLAEMNIKLLQKIEELTLYTIEQENKLEEQKNINREFQSRLLKIEEKIINPKSITNK
jgi:hypothetical protein